MGNKVYIYQLYNLNSSIILRKYSGDRLKLFVKSSISFQESPGDLVTLGEAPAKPREDPESELEDKELSNQEDLNEEGEASSKRGLAQGKIMRLKRPNLDGAFNPQYCHKGEEQLVVKLLRLTEE